MRILRRVFILMHRYIGLLISLLFVIWFASAFAMIYTGGMPEITNGERIARMPALDFTSINLAPADAVPEELSIRDISLESLAGRPVYRLLDKLRRQITVYADTGEKLDAVDVDLAARIAADFLGIKAESMIYAGMLSEPDQWTLTTAGELPMHKFHVNDDKGTQVYVSTGHGKVSVHTTRKTRLQAWAGAIPHWFYLTSLRSNQSLWTMLVVWSAGIGCILTILGLLLALIQFRKSEPFSLGCSIPYSGWLRWHYIFGSVFGLVVLTWTFSGMLSMEPFSWTRSHGLEIPDTVLTGGAFDPELFGMPDNRLAKMVPVGNSIKRLEFLQIWNRPYYLLTYTGRQPSSRVGDVQRGKRILIDANTLAVKSGMETGALVESLNSTVDADELDHTLITEYDNYYYSRKPELPLPVLRIRFNDPAQSWLYIDPAVGHIVMSVSKWNRLERWLYHGLHSLDFSFWYYRRPLWDLGVIFLLAGGMGVSLIGFYLGVHRFTSDIMFFYRRALQIFHR